MSQTTSGSIEFNRDRDTSCETRGEAKEQTQANAIADAENDRVRHGTGKQPQRAMLSPQQVVGKIKAAQHIKKGPCDAYGSYGVVVH